ncbi:MAG: CYTH domain-containing protein [Rhodopirellula sp. JB053]|uniref:CYTH domain-containing protein n=1 Tax=Rhodopirellula sp. JB044 TaxID=3342844 RepID=UPI00370C796F
MGIEIERKFLVKDQGYRSEDSTLLRQGYLSTVKERTVRVRIAGEKAFLTIKGTTEGATRSEYEYEIPTKDAEEMLDKLCPPPLIEKRRYRTQHDGMVWEVDEFFGANEGLVLAEIELDEEGQQFATPSWLGEEVTEDRRYYNANLISNPYSNW